METESQEQRARRLLYRERVREWQSFLDTAGRRGEAIPPDYPNIPPPPDIPTFFPHERVLTPDQRAREEARALARLERHENWARFFADDIAPIGTQGESLRPQMLETLDTQRPEALARVLRQTHHDWSPADVYHQLVADYQDYFGFVPFSDESIRAAAGFTEPTSATRSSWKFWDVYTFSSWEEALAFLRPQAGALTRARRPVMVNAGGVLRAWEGTRYITHVDHEGYHGWANIEPSRLANAIVARAAVISFEINAKFSRVEAVALYIHK